MTFTISRKKGEEVELQALSDVIEIVLAEHKQRTKDNDPIILDLSHVDHGILGIGVGVAGRMFVCHTPADLEPPYHQSVGTSPYRQSVVYLYFGAPTEVQIRNLVDEESVSSILDKFCTTGSLSDRVAWERI